ncbi:proteasome regulatory subunit, putative [Entamoeba histolytica HM-1:IMSS-B]|uniref:Proteasome regulatory subunit, putative n=6 Tax=Entamoeba histolytica TaxID=5759 RepID=C4M7M7_ENTH1|nr:proteasome regulatory subunit, putative [Entamoeba histolytica HM-1:IMSS]EMD46206.1 proteasome regulatory subunit, putative [Entamoeba histolytica KU27]EMH75090.1 proteasome regulatory subunit, putative [Entamoeba histolytica HM-1:IMSS-B]EMS11862.1 proteasome regulatory subunit [Entamoeba histolytica HM-3:IMSS]ENY60637.1 proteasome regulatory subunit, putative [Entamoeba histolytica HM-1:IMSS-A]GAT97543.1 proteasome regulatory subunit putative [Entamoeba histolytica]|eukprot:XP_655395.1 proteasome regulatory subunit, putative [Entamoeba histolytica HM-1:IMSS]
MEIVHDQKYYDSIALQLLTLLAQNSLAEFHIQIESLQQEAHYNNNIKQVISMEQFFIEGRYNRVLEGVQSLQLGDISSLLPLLKQTLVEAVAATIETAYHILPIDYTKKVLMISNDSEFNEVVANHQWKIEGNQIIFELPKVDKKKEETLSSFENISDSLSLIKEMDEMM